MTSFAALNCHSAIVDHITKEKKKRKKERNKNSKTATTTNQLNNHAKYNKNFKK